MRTRLLAALLTAGFLPISALAKIYVYPERLDYPVQVTVQTSYDPATHFYTYTYTVANPSNNPSGVDYVQIHVEPGVDIITDVRSPNDWASNYKEADGKISWGMGDVGKYIPSDYVDDGHSTPPFGPFIQPGHTLNGFSFKSFSPPGSGQGITQTFAQLPTADDAGELDGLPYVSTLAEDNGYRFTTTVPIPDLDYKGNRRPTIDGFLVFANLKDKDAFQGSALIVIRFAAGGEKVLTDTFHATLNGDDITKLFVYNQQYQGLAFMLTPDNSPLKAGTNVLLTSVKGSIPGIIDKVTTDTDRVTFTFVQ